MLTLFSKILSAQKRITRASPAAGDPGVFAVGEELRKKLNALGRSSLAIRQVAAGSSNAEEHELTLLSSPHYDVERFGIRFVASPRHADMLFVTGPVARNMAEPLRRTWEATPDPKIVVAVGDGAIDGGIFKGSYAIAGAVADVIPVDFEIPGDPPSPQVILTALLALIGKLDGKKRISHR